MPIDLKYNKIDFRLWNEYLNETGKNIRKMQSADAAEWLIKEFPRDELISGCVFDIISKRSWKQEDITRLAQHYLYQKTFASAKPYEVFAQKTSLKKLLSILKECIPTNKDDIDLFIYYLLPILKKSIKSEKDKFLVENFLSNFDRTIDSSISL